MPFGFGSAKRIPVSEAKRILWKRQADDALNDAVYLESIGKRELAEESLQYALQLERDAQS